MRLTFSKPHLQERAYLSVCIPLARDIGDLEGGQTPEDAFNRLRRRRLDRCGDASGEELHVYGCPVGRGRHFASGVNRLVDAVIGGWT